MRLLINTFLLIWHCLLAAGIWGYVQYPVMGLASGFAPLTYIDNSTSTPLNYCIRVLSDGGLAPVFTGRNVSCWFCQWQGSCTISSCTIR